MNHPEFFLPVEHQNKVDTWVTERHNLLEKIRRGKYMIRQDHIIKELNPEGIKKEINYSPKQMRRLIQNLERLDNLINTGHAYSWNNPTEAIRLGMTPPTQWEITFNPYTGYTATRRYP